jgi:hypothetical protein
VNETSQIRLENISAQRREIEDLREQVDGGKPASPKLGGASDSQVNDLIKTVGLYFKVGIITSLPSSVVRCTAVLRRILLY